MARYIETGTNYAYTVERIKELNFRSLRSVSVEFTKRLPAELNSELYEGIQHGVCKLQSEPELNMYIHALGLMHEAKLQYAFEQLPDEFTSIPVIDIIDYGCGQAIGTICYADFLRRKGKTQIVRRITLIEPSELALKRAALHVSCFFPQAEIVTHLKGFDDLEEDDLCMNEETPTLHIFSNVIDLADDYFNLERFVNLINKCSIGENHYLCIEPHFDYEEKDKRLERFIGLLDAETYYCKTFPKGTFVEGRDWTCQLVLCKKVQEPSSAQTFIPAVEGTFSPKIKDLISNGAEYVSGSKIEDVVCSINDNVVIVYISLEEPLKGYVLENDGVSYRIGQTNKVITSLNAIIKVLLEDEGLAPITNFIFENPQILSSILKGAIVDILQQDVPKGKEYDSLFNVRKLTNTNNRNVIINDCVRFKLSDNGEKIADKIADILLGFIDDDTIPLLMELANKADEEKQYKKAFEFYKLAAEANNIEAIYKFGIYYYYGQGVAQDYFEAFKWVRKAAELGYMPAQSSLGYCYGKGEGVVKDEVEAVKWYRKAAEQGYAKAQFNLGVGYYGGKGVVKDEVEAVKWYRKAAEQGFVEAQFNLGNCYVKGDGVVKDEVEAVKWYRKAAEQGYAKAQFNLGVGYYGGKGVVKDEVEAVKWYRKAAEQGCAKAQFNLGVCYRKGEGVAKDEVEAITWYVKAARQGEERAKKALLKSGCDVAEIGTDWLLEVAEREFPEALYKLALRYEQGDGVEQSYEEAAKWYIISAKQDNESAKCKLVDLYALGKGVEKSSTEAISWLNKCKWNEKCGNECKEFCISNYLKRDDKKGGKLYSLGSLFYYGKRIEQSYEEAIMWWKMAADVNNSNAAYMLGLCYEEGHGVGQSHEEAVKWWKRAAEANNSNAKYMLGLCYAKGDGVEQSYEKAFGLFVEVARSGFNIEAENIVGTYYEKGLGIKQSYEEAVKWYSMAAKQKNKEAMCNLGNCYRYGRGVKRSYNEAVKWYRESGMKDAQTALDEIYSKKVFCRWLKIILFKFGILK